MGDETNRNSWCTWILAVQIWTGSGHFRWLGRLHPSPLWRDSADLLLWKRRSPKNVNIHVSLKTVVLPLYLWPGVASLCTITKPKNCMVRKIDTATIHLLFPWCQQVSGKATEAGHLRHRPDQTDLHAARLVLQSDSGAAAVLWRQEEPSEPSGNEEQTDLQQGQLCLRAGGGAWEKWLKRLKRNSLTFWEIHWFCFLLAQNETRRSILLLCPYVQYEARDSIPLA